MINVFLPEGLEAFVEEQVARCGYGTPSEYLRELILMQQDRVLVRGWLVEGSMSSPFPSQPADTSNFDALRSRILSSERA